MNIKNLNFIEGEPMVLKLLFYFSDIVKSQCSHDELVTIYTVFHHAARGNFLNRNSIIRSQYKNPKSVCICL